MMDAASEITVYNLHEYITYTILPERQRLVITWDKSNRILNTLICNENSLMFNKGYYKSCLWVNEMKRILEWEQGKSFNISMYLDGNSIPYKIHIYETNFTFLKIDENGYLMVKPPSRETYELCNCLYNDLMNEEYSPYIMN